MKDKDKIYKSFLFSRYKFLLIIFIITVSHLGVFSKKVTAEVDATFIYTLSDFNGPIPFYWTNISVDELKNEIYVVDTREKNVTIFNSQGMEIYRFGDDGNLGTVIDVAVKSDGNILVLSRVDSTSSLILCNFRGEPVAKLELENLPADFSDFSPDRIVNEGGLLHLLDSSSLKIAVTDANGLFQKGYDIASLLDLEVNDRGRATEIAGFSVDHQGNMLFTIPVIFKACQLSPDGNITSFGRPGSAPGRFNVIGGIVADDSYYYVADRLKSAVLIFDKNLRFQSEFGYRGARPGNLIAPNNLGLDAEGKLYVSQLGKGGISVFAITH